MESVDTFPRRHFAGRYRTGTARPTDFCKDRCRTESVDPKAPYNHSRAWKFMNPLLGVKLSGLLASASSKNEQLGLSDGF